MVHPVIPRQALTVRRSRLRGAEIVYLAGEVDVSTVDTLERCLREAAAAAAPPAPIVVDCAGVLFLGSCGLGLLLSVRRMAEAPGTPRRIAAPPRAVRRPILLTGVEQALPMHDTVDDALGR
jgi:anti-sigma B factor antagonist